MGSEPAAPDAVDDAAASDAPAPAATRSRHVRRIVRLEARAQRLLTRYERALDAATRAKSQAHALLDAAHVIECSLSSALRSELYRARGDAARRAATARSVPSDQPPMTMSR